MALCRKSAVSGALGGVTASLLVWTTLHFTQWSAERNLPPSDIRSSATSTVPFFVYKGQALSAQKLSKELRLQFERATTVRDQVQRDAQLQFYKEADKIARLHILEKELAAQSAAQQKNLDEVEAELLPRESATTEDARRLYEASDPSAPREGFAPVKNQLIGYLNEVRRREALEEWSNALRQKGEWSMMLNRPEPLPELSTVNLQGLPYEGKSAPNAIVFVDYLCNDCVPFLVDFAKRVGEQRGTFRPVYVPFPYTRPDVSMALARGSLCAQQSGEFSVFHMAALTKGDLLSEVSVFDLARQSGIKMGDFKACYRSGEGLAELLGRAQALARQFGLMQTPAVVFANRLLEGPEIFKQLDELLKAENASEQLTKRGEDNKRRGLSQP